MVLNWIFRWIIVGPLVRLFFRIHVEGLENLPKRGPYILALGPHRSEFESIIVASYLRRHQLRFYAKEEYWVKHPLLGKIMTAIGLISLPRLASRALLEQISKGVEVLNDDGVLALYIEATRGYDELMHRGYPGFAYTSLRSGGTPIVPVGLIGMRKLHPPGKKLPRPGKATIHIGRPIYPLAAIHSPERHQLAQKALERALIKPLVTEVSKKIALLSGSGYDDKELPIPKSS